MPTVDEINAALKECYDPEIPVNVFDLGLIYGIEQPADDKVQINMTLTSVGCPMAGALVHQVKTRVEEIPGVAEADVNLVWVPPWDPSHATEDGKLQLQALGVPV